MTNACLQQKCRSAAQSYLHSTENNLISKPSKDFGRVHQQYAMIARIDGFQESAGGRSDHSG
jgi:hypothetical protein